MTELALAVSPVIALSCNVLVQLKAGRSGQSFTRSVAFGFGVGLVVCLSMATLTLLLSPFGPLEALCRFCASSAAYLALSFCYFNFLNLGHGSIRMRIFDQVSRHAEGLGWDKALKEYDDERLMEIRLRRLVDHRFIAQDDGRYVLRSKPLLVLASAIRLAKRLITGRASQFEPPRAAARPTSGSPAGDRRSLHPRLVAVLVTAVHVLVLSVGSWIAFSNHREMLFSSLDGVFERNQVRLQHAWMPDILSYAHNPLAGMGNIFGVFNTRIMPCFALSTVPYGGEMNIVMAYTIVAVELFAAMLVLGAVFRLGPSWRFAAAWTLTIYTLPFLWPPKFFHMSELDPHHIELLAATCLIVACYRLVGKGTHLRSALLTLIGFGLVVFMAGSQPQWFIVASVLLIVTLIVLTCASASRRELLVKIAAAATIVVIALPTIGPFVVGGVLNSVPSFFKGELRAARGDVVLTSILFHGVRYSNFGPMIWCMSAVGAALDLYNRRSQTRALAAAALVSHGLILLGIIVTQVLIKNYQGPTYMYFEIFAWHFFAIYAVYLLGWMAAFAWRAWLMTLRWWSASWEVGLRDWTTRAAMVCSLAILLLPAYVVGRTFRTAGTVAFPWRTPAGETKLVSVLKDEIAVTPQRRRFRGSAATFTGFQDTKSVSWIDLYTYDSMMLLNGFGNQHRMLGLWEHNIPTLFDYNYLVPPALYATTTRMLSRPEDEQERNVLVLSRINTPYLESIGTRFIITDFEVPELKLRQQVTSSKCGVTHRLYELPDPNLADYSPTELIEVQAAAQAMKHLQDPGFDFRRQAVVFSAIEARLSPALSSEMETTPDGVIVSAASQGRSLLLLPLEYSHCLDVEVLETDKPSQTPQLLRTNLTQTGLLFSGKSRIRIRFRYGPFTNQFGLLADYRELKQLKLQELPDYHDLEPPHAIADLKASFQTGGLAELPIRTVRCDEEIDEAVVLFDGDPATRWRSPLHESSVREEIVLELDGVRSVQQIRWCCEAGEEHVSPTDVRIATSIDGLHWATISPKDISLEASGRWCVARFPATSARAVRLLPRCRLEHAFFKLHLAEVAVEGLSPRQPLLELAWSAPGDIGEAGRSHEYEARYARRPITTEKDWEKATVLRGLPPAPAEAGTPQTARFMRPFSLSKRSPSMQDAGSLSEVDLRHEVDIVSQVIEQLRNDGGLQNLTLAEVDDQQMEHAIRSAIAGIQVTSYFSGTPYKTIYCAVRSRDRSGNLSPLSNCVRIDSTPQQEAAAVVAEKSDEPFPPDAQR
ncbi:MAG: hypothetical protein RIC55_16950 [Pirellulaceae bacterium]